MDLIAIKPFARNGDLKLYIPETDLDHPGHVPTGTRFSVGEEKDMTKLNTKDVKLTASEKVLIASLLVTGSVGDANDPKVVKSVQDLLDADKARAQSDATLNSRAANAELAAAQQRVKDTPPVPSPAKK
jgi:hypothetical protein